MVDLQSTSTRSGFKSVPLDRLRGYVPGVEYHEPFTLALVEVCRRFKVILKPLIVNARTGRVLSPPSELETFAILRQSDPALLAQLLPENKVPCWVVEIAPEDESMAAIILAGGVDRVLLPRLRDEALVPLLIRIAEHDLGAVQTFGISLDELHQILDAYVEGAAPAAPASIPTTPGLNALGIWGIPELSLENQAITSPSIIFSSVIKWGTQKRGAGLPGALVHFYTADEKFTALLKDAGPIFRANPAAVVELNISTGADMAGALVLWQTYQKRTFSAALQNAGLPVVVDLNVDREWFDVNMIGVPDGWLWYANRARSSDLDHLREAYELARDRAGNTDIMYLVYGGGAKAQRYCARRGWTWLPEDSDVKRGRAGADGSQ